MHLEYYLFGAFSELFECNKFKGCISNCKRSKNNNTFENKVTLRLTKILLNLFYLKHQFDWKLNKLWNLNNLILSGSLKTISNLISFEKYFMGLYPIFLNKNNSKIIDRKWLKRFFNFLFLDKSKLFPLFLFLNSRKSKKILKCKSRRFFLRNIRLTKSISKWFWCIFCVTFV